MFEFHESISHFLHKKIHSILIIQILKLLYLQSTSGFSTIFDDFYREIAGKQ